ncbi:3'-5' exoribonuclease CSL4 [Apiospora phragmitis]|uniref:3'-5' exoribonuclease CSL4 n=1 Tax=Apiospora phragmitis TaxID=2905665 RepID=A0ABR1UIJ2_9PEZI
MAQTIAIPGQLLGPSSKYVAGPGTHIHEANLYSSVLGTVTVAQPEKKNVPGPAKRLTKIAGLPSSSSAQQLPTISVSRTGVSEKREVLPEVGNIVLCRVTRIQPRQATVAILVVGDTVLEAEWQGVIRPQDVRATEKDKVKIYESFRPGDIVRAQVISLGDQASYYLATASNDLGVIMATSEAGNVMYPVSWKEYRDPETGMNENRKVAKPF